MTDTLIPTEKPSETGAATTEIAAEESSTASETTSAVDEKSAIQEAYEWSGKMVKKATNHIVALKARRDPKTFLTARAKQANLLALEKTSMPTFKRRELQERRSFEMDRLDKLHGILMQAVARVAKKAEEVAELSNAKEMALSSLKQLEVTILEKDSALVELKIALVEETGKAATAKGENEVLKKAIEAAEEKFRVEATKMQQKLEEDAKKSVERAEEKFRVEAHKMQQNLEEDAKKSVERSLRESKEILQRFQREAKVEHDQLKHEAKVKDDELKHFKEHAKNEATKMSDVQSKVNSSTKMSEQFAKEARVKNDKITHLEKKVRTLEQELETSERFRNFWIHHFQEAGVTGAIKAKHSVTVGLQTELSAAMVLELGAVLHLLPKQDQASQTLKPVVVHYGSSQTTESTVSRDVVQQGDSRVDKALTPPLVFHQGKHDDSPAVELPTLRVVLQKVEETGTDAFQGEVNTEPERMSPKVGTSEGNAFQSMFDHDDESELPDLIDIDSPEEDEDDDVDENAEGPEKLAAKHEAMDGKSKECRFATTLRSSPREMSQRSIGNEKRAKAVIIRKPCPKSKQLQFYFKSQNLSKKSHRGASERKFACAKCDKSYAKKCHLNEHMLAHRGETFLCQLAKEWHGPRKTRRVENSEVGVAPCGLRFDTRKKLKNHQRSHHKICNRAGGCNEKVTDVPGKPGLFKLQEHEKRCLPPTY